MPSNKKAKKAKKPTVDFGGSQPQWGARPDSGLVVSEIERILAQGDFIGLKNVAETLRYLYSHYSMGFTPSELSLFGQACLCGQLEPVRQAIESGTAPDLGGTETAYQHGYASQIINGSQRIAPLPNGQRAQHYEVLEYLISQGLALSIPDICGYTALHHSVLGTSLANKEAIIRLMLKSGADIHYRNRFGEIPLFNAIQSADILGVELLMEYGSDIDLADPTGGTPRNSYLSCGPQVTAVMRKWILKRNGEQAPLMEKKCDHCEDAEKSLKRCTKCRSVQYCSVECQRAAWPAHKKTCHPFDVSTTVTIVPFYHDKVGTNLPRSPIERGLGGLPTDPVPMNHFRSSHVPGKLGSQGKTLIIKIQIPQYRNLDGSYGDLYVYDKKRDFVCFLRRQYGEAAYDRIVQVVKSQGVAGLKAYFVAELRSKTELVVKVSEVMAVQPF